MAGEANAEMNCSCRKPDRWIDDLGRVLCFKCMGQLDEECYEYEALRSPSEIRLIWLHAGQRKDAIFCEIVHEDLDRKPIYEAISYCWGEPRFTEQIICQNSGILRVTSTCAAALRELRYATKKRSLWIDAVCIDQESIHERNHQVKLMQRIYSQSQEVMVHLGPASRTPSTAIQLLNHIFKNQPLSKSNMQAGLTDLISLPWFSRVWVLQELASARGATVVIGPHRFDWNILSLHYISGLDLLASNRKGHVPTVLSLAPGTITPFRDLGSLINAARNCSSSDPRDKVYALLGLFNDRSKLEISPKYNKAVENVYVETTECIIRATAQLDILSEVGREANLAEALRESFQTMGRVLELHVDEKLKQIKERFQEINSPAYSWSMFDKLSRSVRDSISEANFLDNDTLQNAYETLYNFKKLYSVNQFAHDSEAKTLNRLRYIPYLLRVSKALDEFEPILWWRSQSILDELALWINRLLEDLRSSSAETKFGSRKLRDLFPEIDKALSRGYEVDFRQYSPTSIRIRRATPGPELSGIHEDTCLHPTRPPEHCRDVENSTIIIEECEVFEDKGSYGL